MMMMVVVAIMMMVTASPWRSKGSNSLPDILTFSSKHQRKTDDDDENVVKGSFEYLVAVHTLNTAKCPKLRNIHHTNSQTHVLPRQDVTSSANISSHCEKTFRANFCEFRLKQWQQITKMSTLSNGRLSHLDRWMEHFSQVLVVQLWTLGTGLIWTNWIENTDAENIKAMSVSHEWDALKTQESVVKANCWMKPSRLPRWAFGHFCPLLNAIEAANSESNGQTDGVCKLQISGELALLPPSCRRHKRIGSYLFLAWQQSKWYQRRC